MAMVAVGGSIGTGLLLGSGAAVRIAGPAVVLTYILGALIAWTVTMALGEMASAHPAAGSFGVYAERYLNPWAGFVARYGYWFAVVIAVAAELVAAATYTAFWFPRVPALVGVMPWQAAGVRQSPFVTVFEVAGIPAASTLMNIVVLTAALSSANANLYVAARMLFSLARGGHAPETLGRLTASGSPRTAVGVSATGMLLAVIAQKFAPESAYLYMIGASLF